MLPSEIFTRFRSRSPPHRTRGRSRTRPSSRRFTDLGANVGAQPCRDGGWGPPPPGSLPSGSLSVTLALLTLPVARWLPYTFVAGMSSSLSLDDGDSA